MNNVINMQDLRYLNLFGKITRVNTRFCFKYNESLVFCVPKRFISKAIGEGGKNIKQMNEILNKKIKVIPSPLGVQDITSFLESIVSPVKFREIEIKNNEIILTAGSQNKAALIGRNKRRLLEMQKIIEDFFNKELRIV